MQRRHDLDWVRVAAFFLLVLYHTGMYYVTWDWHVKSPHASDALEPFMVSSSPWRLSLLFLVSGTATAFLFRKRAAAGKGFLGQRSWRLLVPLVFGMLVIVTPQSYYEVVEQLPGGYHDGYLAFWGRYLHAVNAGVDLASILDPIQRMRKRTLEGELLETERLKKVFRSAVNDPTALTGKFEGQKRLEDPQMKAQEKAQPRLVCRLSVPSNA